VAESGVVPGGFKSWGELRATQQKLNAAGVVAAPENRELGVYCAGDMSAPSGLTDLVWVAVGLTAPGSRTAGPAPCAFTLPV
jgi:hypothetical protein